MDIAAVITRHKQTLKDTYTDNMLTGNEVMHQLVLAMQCDEDTFLSQQNTDTGKQVPHHASCLGFGLCSLQLF